MFAPLQNDTFLRALQRQPVSHTPTWLMRQAGRYLPEYLATRGKAGSFMGLATNPELACEVTLQPIDRYGFDAAILFSDILTVPDAMGLGLTFAAGEGPRFSQPLKDETAIQKLAVPDMAKLQYVFDAVKTIRTALNGRVPLIGFSGSPWTLACYMVEGQGSSDFANVKAMLYKRPDLMQHILQTNIVAVTQYLNAQIEAGAQAVMIFDTWGGLLADGQYQQTSLSAMQQVINGLHKTWHGEAIPSIVFTKGGGQWLSDIAQCGTSGVGLDWTVNLSRAKAMVGNQVALQGNLDPSILLADETTVVKETQRVLDNFGKVENGQGHIFNLGHGITQFTPPQNVTALIETVKSYSRQFHA